MAKVVFVRGGPGRRPMTWEVARAGGLSRDYVFVPGVPTDVADSDVAILLSPAQTRGRVFEQVGPARQDPEPKSKAPKLDTPAAAIEAVEKVVSEFEDLVKRPGPANDPKSSASPGAGAAPEN